MRTITSGSNVSDKDLNPMLIAVDKNQQMQARITPVGKGKKIVQHSDFRIEMGQQRIASANTRNDKNQSGR